MPHGSHDTHEIRGIYLLYLLDIQGNQCDFLISVANYYFKLMYYFTQDSIIIAY